MQIDVTVQDANNILCEVTPPQPQIIVIDRGVEGNGIVSIVPVTISTFQYLRITYTNGTVQDVGPLTSTAYTATAPITIVGNTISLATVPIASGGTDATTAAGAIQNLLPSYTGNANKRLGLNSLGTALEWVLDGGGTVTSVAASGGTTGLTFTGSPITTSGTLTLGGTLAVANGGTGVTSSTGTGSVVLSTSPTLVTPVLGTPTSGNFSTGTFTWPTFNQNTTGTAANITATSNSTLTTLSALSLPGSQVSGNISGNAANVTGVVAIANGGTGQTTANAALNALLPTQTGNASKYLQTDGTNATWDAISLSTADITGILPTANGGTGLSSFTANGVVYASSTSALTTGSALVFDGTNFGIGVASPTAKLDLSANNPIMGYFRSSGGSANDKRFTITSGGDRVVLDSASNSTGASAAFSFTLGGTEGMRLTSTGLGIGTSSPSQKLHVVAAGGYNSTFSENSANKVRFQIYVDANETALVSGYDTTAKPMTFYTGGSLRATLDSSGNLGLGVAPAAYSESSKFTINATGKTNGIYINFNGTGADKQILLTNGGSANCFIGTDNTAMTLGTGNTERMRLDSSGNLGLGVTPSAWGSTYKAIDIGAGGAIQGRSNTAGTFELATNAYLNTSGNWTYKASSIAANLFAMSNGSYAWNIAPSGTAGNTITFTQAMTLDSSGRLGIGTTSPAVSLDVAGGSSADVISIRGRTSDNFGLLSFATSAGTKNAYIGSTDSTNLVFYTNGFTERARIDSSGRFGIGVTPSAWGSGYKVLQIGNAGFMNSGASTWFYNNSYFNGTNNIYTTTAAATRYVQSSGAHNWDIAPSGTAGTAISFTQAMTLTSGGDLLVGKTSSNTNVAGTEILGGSNAGILALTIAGRPLYINRLTTDGTLVEFAQDGTTEGSISVSGSTTSYNTSSDYRLKNTIAPMTGALAKVALLKPCTYKWNADGSDGEGFIAHELAEVVPQCVTGEKDAVDEEGNPKYQGIDVSFLVATLTAAIQEQQAIINSLKARLDAANL